MKELRPIDDNGIRALINYYEMLVVAKRTKENEIKVLSQNIEDLNETLMSVGDILEKFNCRRISEHWDWIKSDNKVDDCD